MILLFKIVKITPRLLVSKFLFNLLMNDYFIPKNFSLSLTKSSPF